MQKKSRKKTVRVRSHARSVISEHTFRHLLISLSDAIGDHQIPLVENEMHPSKVIAPDAVHYDLVKKIARSVYRANRCFHVNAPVELRCTFDALGKIHGELMQSDRTDIDQINLVHEIGICTADFFGPHNCVSSDARSASNSGSEAQVQQV